MSFHVSVFTSYYVLVVECEGRPTLVKQIMLPDPSDSLFAMTPEFRTAASVEGAFRMARETLDHAEGLSIEADYDRQLGFPTRFTSWRSGWADTDLSVIIDKLEPIDCGRCDEVRAEVEAVDPRFIPD